jgi:hypothetical protein
LISLYSMTSSVVFLFSLYCFFYDNSWRAQSDLKLLAGLPQQHLSIFFA